MATSAQPPPRPSKEELVRLVKARMQSWGEWQTTGQTLDLRGVDLASTDITGIDLSHAILRDADLRYAKMAGANLSKADLRGADLSYSDLTKAKLDQTNMRGASLLHARLAEVNLFEADLTRATLQSANLKGVHLIRTNLRDANLRDTDLRDITGPLLPSQLAGSDLTAAALPEPLEKLYEKLGSVNEISDSAKKLFLAMLAACVYSWLTIGTTKDVDLITNRASTPLPIIQTAIPIVGFYVVAPIILLCIYFYFHFYLQKLWEELASLPAIFSDGRPLYSRVDPWLFNDLVRAHFPRLKKDRPLLSYFQQWISILLAWWLVPITLLLFWGRYLPRHGTYGTTFHSVMLALGIVAAVRLYLLARKTLRGGQRLSLKHSLKRPGLYLGTIVAAGSVTAMIVISLGAVFGVPPEDSPHPSLRTWVPWMMHLIRYSPFADIPGAELSLKPPNWTGKKDEELDQVKGAKFYNRSLRYALAPGAFLARADLGQADLVGAFLVFADLRQASLEKADLSRGSLHGAFLQRADLKHSKLDHADLQQAHLEDTNLTDASMAGAWLGEAKLTNALLVRTDLSGANLTVTSLSGATFKFADFTDAVLYQPVITYAVFDRSKGLTPEMIQSCQNWEMAFYDDDTLKQLGLPPDHNEALVAYRQSGSEEPFDSWKVKWRKKNAKAAAKKSK